MFPKSGPARNIEQCTNSIIAGHVVVKKTDIPGLFGDSNPGPPAPKAGIIATRPNSQMMLPETFK